MAAYDEDETDGNLVLVDDADVSRLERAGYPVEVTRHGTDLATRTA
ncbi:hypothetical protein [Natronococcus jeotgali]|nr:hypothetical protein [Natronococcus jeotgali]